MIIKLFPDSPESAGDTNNDKAKDTSLGVALAIAAATPGSEGGSSTSDEQKDEDDSKSAVTKSNSTEDDSKDEGEEESTESEEKEPTNKPEGETEGDGQDEQEQGDEKKDEDADDGKDEEDSSKVIEEENKRLDKNPRFQELTKKVQELEPLANRMRDVEKWMKDNGVMADEASQALNLITMLKNPARADEAYKVLEPIIQGLQAARGEVLPADLQKDVDDGNVSLPRAKELARFRAQTVMNQEMAKSNGQQQFATQCKQAVESWEESTKKVDPDYSRKFPFMKEALIARISANPSATPQQRVQMCVEIHKEITERLGEFMPKPKARKSLGTQTGSTVRSKKEPKTTLDVALDVANRTPLDD